MKNFHHNKYWLIFFHLFLLLLIDFLFLPIHSLVIWNKEILFQLLLYFEFQKFDCCKVDWLKKRKQKKKINTSVKSMQWKKAGKKRQNRIAFTNLTHAHIHRSSSKKQTFSKLLTLTCDPWYDGECFQSLCIQ